MQINTCTNYYLSDCYAETKSNKIIPSYSTLKYTIKWNKTHIAYINHNNINDQVFEKEKKIKGFIYCHNQNPYITIEEITTNLFIYINSVVFKAEMFKYKLSLSGDSMNYCYNNGCPSGYYNKYVKKYE